MVEESCSKVLVKIQPVRGKLSFRRMPESRKPYTSTINKFLYDYLIRTINYV